MSIYKTLINHGMDEILSGKIDKVKSPEATHNEVLLAIQEGCTEFLEGMIGACPELFFNDSNDIAIKAGDVLVETVVAKLIEMWEAEHDQDRTIMVLLEQIQSQRKHIASLQAANQSGPNSIFDEEF